MDNRPTPSEGVQRYGRQNSHKMLTTHTVKRLTVWQPPALCSPCVSAYGITYDRRWGDIEKPPAEIGRGDRIAAQGEGCFPFLFLISSGAHCSLYILY